MEPLDKTSLAEQAVEAIKRHILTRHLQAGDRLPSERQLSKTLSISRQVLREALSILVGRGIVRKVPGKGVFVGDFDWRSLGVDIRLIITDKAQLGALRDFRGILEIGALAFIAERITPEELDQLEEMIETMERKLSRGEQINKLDTEFHLALFKAAHIPALSQLYEQVLRDVTAAILLDPALRTILTPEISGANLALLRQVTAALHRSDVNAAQQAMKAHIGFSVA